MMKICDVSCQVGKETTHVQYLEDSTILFTDDVWAENMMPHMAHVF